MDAAFEHVAREPCLVPGGTSSSEYFAEEYGPSRTAGGGGYGGNGTWVYVAGEAGWASGNGTDFITVQAASAGFWVFVPSSNSYSSNYSGGGYNGGSQSGVPSNPTPCVDEFPAGIDASNINLINDLAKAASAELTSKQDSTGWEWGAFIYESGGQYYWSEPFTAGHFDDMNGAKFNLPAGATIVGYLHTHPEDNVMDQRWLSSDDRTFIRTLTSSFPDRVDPNMLAYIVTKDGLTGYKTLGLTYEI